MMHLILTIPHRERSYSFSS